MKVRSGSGIFEESTEEMSSFSLGEYTSIFQSQMLANPGKICEFINVSIRFGRQQMDSRMN